MEKELKAIGAETKRLWYEVNEKYGDHKYTLAVNGLGEATLQKGYTEEIARGEREVRKKLKELLKG